MVRDKEFSRTPPPIFSSDVLGIEKPKKFPKRELDQEASREASMAVFRLFVINGEGLPSGGIYKDDWLKDIWDEEETDEKDDDADIQGSQVPVSQTEDRFESLLSTVE